MTRVTSSKFSMKLREVKILVGVFNRFDKIISQISSSRQVTVQIKIQNIWNHQLPGPSKGCQMVSTGVPTYHPFAWKNGHPFFQVLVEIAQDLTKCPGPIELWNPFTFQLQVTFHAWRGVPGRSVGNLTAATCGWRCGFKFSPRTFQGNSTDVAVSKWKKLKSFC